jgi:hypothetical protein
MRYLVILLLGAASGLPALAEKPTAWQDAVVSNVDTAIVADSDGPTFVTKISFQTPAAVYTISCYRHGFWKCPSIALADHVKIAPEGSDLRIEEPSGKTMKRHLVGQTLRQSPN